MPVLGPGTLKIGATGTEIDVSCLVNGCRVSPTKNEGDATQKLCGTKVPGAITYTAKLTGNIDIDSDDGAAGLFALSWSAPGSQQGFTFVPNTAEGTAAAGTLVLDPLDFGADKYGDLLTSDFEFTIVGDVEFTYAGGATMVMRTGVPIEQERIGPPAPVDAAPRKTKTKASA
jgi:hypothetical protein